MTKHIYRTTYFFLITNLIVCCSQTDNRSSISITLLKETNETVNSIRIQEDPKSDFGLIYYFDGNCGQCLLNVKLLTTMLSNAYPKMNMFYLSSSQLNSEAKQLLEFLSIDFKILQESIDFAFVGTPAPMNLISIIDKDKQIVYTSNLSDTTNLRLKINELINYQ